EPELTANKGRADSPRSGCNHKAWGGAQRNPRKPSLKIIASPRSGRQPSDKSFIVCNLILFQELNELIPKRNVPMMFLLSRNVLAHCCNIRLAYCERTITTLP